MTVGSPTPTVKNDAGARLAYIPELDGLRAIAIGAVLLDHTMPRYFPGGFIGVDIFFVLSGYLITTILYREYMQEGRIRLGSFYMRRTLRLVPALFAMLGIYVLVLVVHSLVFSHDRLRDPLVAVLSSALYLMNWAEIFDITPGAYLDHTWSLGVEEQFYILWPLTLLAILRYRDRASAWKAVVALILLVTAWRTLLVFKGGSLIHIYAGLDTRIDTLLVGCLLALAPVARWQRFASRFWVGAAFILLVLSMTLSWKSPLVALLGFPLTALCAVSLIAAAMSGNPQDLLRRCLRWAPLNYCGKVSYGFYLWHYPVGVVVAMHVGGTFLGDLEGLVATGITTLVIASLSYRILELPALGLRSKFR